MKLFQKLFVVIVVQLILFYLQVHFMSFFSFVNLLWSKLTNLNKYIRFVNNNNNHIICSSCAGINFYCNKTNFSYNHDEVKQYMKVSRQGLKKVYDKCLPKKPLIENILVQHDVNVEQLTVKERAHLYKQMKKSKIKAFDLNDTNIELYKLKLDVMSLKVNLDLSPNRPMRCFLRMFHKIPNEPELTVKMSRTHEFLKKFKYELILKDFGFSFVTCFIPVESRAKAIWRTVFNVLPRNMRKLIDKSSENLAKINSQKESIVERNSSNPLLKDSHFDSCGSSIDLTSNKEKLNLFILAFDSVSFKHFRRIFPASFNYLTKEMSNNIIFENFNKIGENTYPNIVPLMTGALVERINELKIKADIDYYRDVDSTFHDYFPFIWREFEKIGYFTMYNEEYPRFSTFCYRKKGFRYSPTSYYGFPFYYVYSRIFNQPIWCLNHRPAYETTLENIERVLFRFKEVPNLNLPFFSFNFMKFYTHDYFTMPPGFDQRIRQFLKFFNENFSNNTMLILMGDHGSRLSSYSYNSEYGKIERSLPFLSIRLPDLLWNSKFGANLRNNKNKLVTVLDVYKTMKQFYYLNRYGLNDEKVNSKECRDKFQRSSIFERQMRGISFFEEIPTNRSCQDALIANTYCTCIQRERINENKFFAETRKMYNETAGLIVNYVNSLTNQVRDKCWQFVYDSVKTVKRSDYMSKVVYEFSVYVIPGPALFQGSIRLENDQLILFDKIIRLDKYGKQSNCMNDTKFYGFCYCRLQQTKNLNSL